MDFEENASRFEHFFSIIPFILQTLYEMIYLTCNLNPFPSKSVSDKISPTEIGFNILVVACPTYGLFVFAETAIPIDGAVSLIFGFKSFFQAVYVSLKFFCSLLLIDPPSSIF